MEWRNPASAPKGWTFPQNYFCKRSFIKIRNNVANRKLPWGNPTPWRVSERQPPACTCCSLSDRKLWNHFCTSPLCLRSIPWCRRSKFFFKSTNRLFEFLFWIIPLETLFVTFNDVSSVDLPFVNPRIGRKWNVKGVKIFHQSFIINLSINFENIDRRRIPLRLLSVVEPIFIKIGMAILDLSNSPNVPV